MCAVISLGDSEDTNLAVESAKKAGCIPILKINKIQKNPSFSCTRIQNLVEIKKLIN